jgi:cytochrome c551/c552
MNFIKYDLVRNKPITLVFATILILSCCRLAAQESPKETDYFKIFPVTAPEDAVLEVGGLASIPNGDLAVATRRGDIYIIENPTARYPYFRKFASGLHEVLGLAYKDGALYAAQRGELTKITDTNKDGHSDKSKLSDTGTDGKADTFETIYAWPLTGNYHEYSYGPKIAADGTFFVSANVAFFDEEWWSGASRVPWRGWVMHITGKNKMEPWATGMRSPCGLGIIDGELFYADNQGDWIGSGGIWHLKKGAWTGHPAGLQWSGQPNSPVKISKDDVYAIVDPRKKRGGNGEWIKPENNVNDRIIPLYTLKDKFPALQTPAVWLPHGIFGVSNSELVKIPDNAFGAFGGQILIGDQGQSKIMRVFMEKVKGEYQGAAFDFRSGFNSGVLRMAWAGDGSLFVGETSRGWGASGNALQGLERLAWSGQDPFEMKAVRAMPDGFEIEFTKPADSRSAANPASYNVSSFIYKYHPVYGSPPVNQEVNKVKGVKLSPDGLKARIVVDNLRPYYIHEIRLPGVKSAEGAYTLVHPLAYYTLNNIPDGEKLGVSELNTKKPGGTGIPAKLTGKPTSARNHVPTFEEIKPLLGKYTCLACHSADKRQVGPAYASVAQKNYTNEQIVELIYNPKPKNWPDFATEMPPMPQVPKSDALRIAAWINSLSKN